MKNFISFPKAKAWSFYFLPFITKLGDTLGNLYYTLNNQALKHLQKHYHAK